MTIYCGLQVKIALEGIAGGVAAFAVVVAADTIGGLIDLNLYTLK